MAFTICVIAGGPLEFEFYGVSDDKKMALLLFTSEGLKDVAAATKSFHREMPALEKDIIIKIPSEGFDWSNGVYVGICGKLDDLREAERKRVEEYRKLNEQKFGPIWDALLSDLTAVGQEHQELGLIAIYEDGDKERTLLASNIVPVWNEHLSRYLHSGPYAIIRVLPKFIDVNGQSLLSRTYTVLENWQRQDDKKANLIVRRKNFGAVRMSFGKDKGKEVGTLDSSYLSYLQNKVTDPKPYQVECLEAAREVLADRGGK